MKRIIGVNITDRVLLDKIRDILPNDNYTIQTSIGKRISHLATIITDNPEYLETIKENLVIPVLYIHNPTKASHRNVGFRNVFRAIVPTPDFNQVTEIPSKEDPKKRKSLEEMVVFSINVRDNIDRNKLITLTKGFREDLEKEKTLTRNGDCGEEKAKQSKLKTIRGRPRLISNVEATNQIISAFKEFYPNKERVQRLTVDKSILFISPNTDKIINHAKFLESMTSAFIEIRSQVDSPPIQDILREKYSLIIYDASHLASPVELEYLLELSDRSWDREIDIITMCDTKTITRIMASGSEGYKFHNYFNTDIINPTKLLENVLHILKEQSNIRLADMLDQPNRALFSDAIDNLKSEDKRVIERGKKQLLHGLAIETGRRYEELLDLDVLATEELFLGKPLKLPDLGYLIKFFKDSRRAKCEILALKFLHKHNSDLESKLEKIKAGLLPEKEALYWKNIPKIRTREDAVDYKTILIGSYIFGPTLEELAPEINRKIKEKDSEAIEFRNRILFEMNRYCAFLQVKGIPLGDIETEPTTFKKDFIRIVNETKILGLPISKEEYKCAKLCSDILDLNIRDPSSTQYFDFYWDNIILETGNDSDSFEDIMKKRKESGNSIKQFVEEKTISRIDFNKIYRKTSMTEDPSRFAVKNFMRSPKTKKRIIEEERKIFYTNLLLYRKKFQLLEELIAPATEEESLSKYPKIAPKIKEINLLIDKLENGQDIISEEEKTTINQFITKEKDDFFYTEPYVTMYRTVRHTILLYNNIQYKVNKLQDMKISENKFEKDMEFIEKELHESYSQAARILNKIIDEKKKCLRKRDASTARYDPLIKSSKNDLDKESAQRYMSHIEQIKKIENPPKRDALFTYVAANYLSAFFKKISKSSFDIKYSKLGKE